MLTRRRKRLLWLVLGTLTLLTMTGAGLVRHYFGDLRVSPGTRADSPAEMARWPWPAAKITTPHPGVTHYTGKSSSDGTVLHLLDFDFGKNPHLRLELYDQDEDDAVPFDNKAKFKHRGVGQVTRHLNRVGRGKVVAAWNGLFFQYTGDAGSHVAPVVLNGRALYNVGTVRWSVGVKYEDGRPDFKVMRLPDFATLASEYDFAAEGASCLVCEGQPLRLQPFPKPGEGPLPKSIPPGPGEAGFVRQVDHIRTSRTSMAWSEDNRHFYVLIVKEPDAEAPSISALRHGIPLMGGWTVADIQRFWRRFGAW